MSDAEAENGGEKNIESDSVDGVMDTSPVEEQRPEPVQEVPSVVKKESSASTASTSFRSDILARLEARDAATKQFTSIFSAYAHLVEELAAARRLGTSRQRHASASDGGGGASSAQVEALRIELSDVYKKKCINDQQLLDTGRQLQERTGELDTVRRQHSLLLSERDSLKARVSQLEHACKEANEDRTTARDELVALQASFVSIESRLRESEKERLVLIAKIRELQEKQANMFNEEVNQQTERQQRKIQEEIARALADNSRDAAVSSAIAAAAGGPVCVGDSLPTKCSTKFECAELDVTECVWLSDSVFATGGSDKKVRVWRSEPGGRTSKMYTLAGCNQSITRMDGDADTHSLLASSNDNTVRLWNTDTQRIVHTLSGHGDKVSAARFHMPGQAVSGGFDRMLKLWDLKSQRCIRSFFPGSTVLDVAAKVHAAGNMFISGHFDRKMRVWDGRSAGDEPIHTCELGGKVTSICASQDGQQVLCSTRDDSLSLIDLRSYHVLHIYSAEQYRTASDQSRVTLSPGGEYCAAGSADGHVFVWNVRTTKLEKVLYKGGHEQPIMAVSWNPSGRGLMSVDKQKMLCMWQ